MKLFELQTGVYQALIFEIRSHSGGIIRYQDEGTIQLLQPLREFPQRFTEWEINKLSEKWVKLYIQSSMQFN